MSLKHVSWPEAAHSSLREEILLTNNLGVSRGRAFTTAFASDHWCGWADRFAADSVRRHGVGPTDREIAQSREYPQVRDPAGRPACDAVDIAGTDLLLRDCGPPV